MWKVMNVTRSMTAIMKVCCMMTLVKVTTAVVGRGE